MSRTVSLALVAAVAGAAACGAAAPAPAAPPKPHADCAGSGSIAKGVRARIFQRDLGDGDYAVIACDLLTGNQTEVAKGTFRDSDGVRFARFAGRFIAFEHASCAFTLNPTPCPRQVRSIDVKTGRELSAAPDESGITDLAVSRSGAFAWSQGGPAPGVIVRDASTTRSVATGPVEAGSLALSRDGRVYWTAAAGVPGSAQLEGARREPAADRAIGGHRACYPRGSATDAASTRARVYTEVRGETVRLVACDLRSGRRTVADEGTDGIDAPSFDRLALAGSHLATAYRSCAGMSCAGGALSVLDARTGRVTRGPDQGIVGVRVTDLVVSPTGAFAWIREEANGTHTVRACGDVDCATLDAGRGVVPTSLALARGGRMYWTNLDAALSAPLE
jgi:hypothetical protein